MLVRPGSRSTRHAFAFAFRIFAATLGASLLLPAVPVAFSQEPDPEALIREGVEARRRRDDLAAVALFERAVAIRRSPRAVGQLGLAEQALGRWVAADTHLSEALAAGDDAWVRERREILERAAADVGTHVGRLEVLCTVPDARVSVDGHPLGALPLGEPLRLLVGSVIVEVSAPGHFPRTRPLNISAGILTRETFELVPEPAAPPPVVTSSFPLPVADPPQEPSTTTNAVVTPAPAGPATSAPPAQATPVVTPPVLQAAPEAPPAAAAEDLSAGGFAFAFRLGYSTFTTRGDGLFSSFGGGNSQATTGGPSVEVALGGRLLGGHLELGVHLQGAAILVDAPFDEGFDEVMPAARAGAHVGAHLAGDTSPGSFDLFVTAGFDPAAFVYLGGPSVTESLWSAFVVPLSLGGGIHIGRGWMIELGLQWDLWIPREYTATTIDGSRLSTTSALTLESMLGVTLGIVRAR